MKRRILIVEDDPTLRLALEDALELEGYEVAAAADGGHAEELLYGRHWDLVLLDVMLPIRGGLEILKGIRDRRLALPVILLTARNAENDKVLGLELGADDYVTKPFGLRELLARIRALLRREERHREAGASSESPARFRIGAAEIDGDALVVRRAGGEEPITPKEAAMLALLNREAGRVVSRERFLREIWGGGEHVTRRTVDTHVLNLRKKIEDDPTRPRLIVTVHGAGYRLVLGDEAS